MKPNLFSYPKTHSGELVTELHSTPSTRIEQIVSYGDTTPQGQWYDQDEDEWVSVLEGEGHILFEDGTVNKLRKGDSLVIEAHRKHRVVYTENPTMWLCVFMGDSLEKGA